MPDDVQSTYALNPISLGYVDPELEAEYQSYQPAMLVRTLRPLLIVLMPLVAALGIVDYLAVTVMTFLPWQACVVLAAAFGFLLVLTFIPSGKRYIQFGLLTSLVLFALTLLLRVSNADELVRFFPGYFIVLIMSHFIGLRFTYGLAAALLLIGALVAAIALHGIGFVAMLDMIAFLVPGYAIAATAGYTMERQRRRLFAQVRLMELERNQHAQMALHDPLTQLPNRILLHERMRQSLARSKRQHGQFAVLFVDLDDFKSVNDSYGHAIGDRVLKQIAANLQHQVRGEDTVARLGGDEFVVLSEHVDDERGAQIAADRVQSAISKPIIVHLPQRADTIHVHVTCSIGIALCPRDGDTLEQLIGRADEAMYKAKRVGKHTSRFFRDPDEQSTDAEQSAG